MKYLPLFCALSLPFPVLSHTAPASASQSATRSWVSLQATTSKPIYAPGEAVSVRLTAKNNAKTGAYLKFSSGQRFDFSVFKSGTTQSAYTWSASRMFMQSLGSLWIPAGQTQKFEAAIGDEMGRLKPGKYRLVARLANTGNLIQSAPIEFEIAAPKLQISAKTDKVRYKIGEPVKIDFAVKNTAQTPTRVTFGSGQTYDVFIFDAQNRQIWSYAANLRFIMVQTPITWQAGEIKNFSTIWNGIPLADEAGATLKPGKYRVQVQLSSQPSVDAPPLSIEISP
ncbi:MAG TPA: BsuPI-related putative proteinase inhibitor [Abditibacterium sp.]